LQELSDSFVIDLRNYQALGEVFRIGLYLIPPQPKKIRQYVITKSNGHLFFILNAIDLFIQNFNILDDHAGKLVPFEYPTIDKALIETSWNEYWRKKQEFDKSGNPEKDETMNGTLKSNDFLESKLGS